MSLTTTFYTFLAPDGSHCFLKHHRGWCAHLPPLDFEALWRLGDLVPPTVTRFKKTMKRKEASTVAHPFAGRTPCVLQELTPELEAILAAAVQVLDQEDGGHDASVVGLHVNWYPDGTAGIPPHADDDPGLVPGAPVVSFTFLSDPARPRPFQVYRKGGEKPAPLLEASPGHGEVLVMKGPRMQLDFTHGVKPTAARRYADLRRVNVTARRFLAPV